MFDWYVPDDAQNPDTYGRPVLMDGFHYDTLRGLDTLTNDTLAKLPLRESGEDDSHLFVLEPTQDGHKEHHAGKIYSWIVT